MKQLLPLYLLLFSICIAFAGCSRERPVLVPVMPAVPDTTNIHTTVDTANFLALGDSYTIGESVTAEERFPAQTAAWLKNKDIEASPLLYIAQTGWTTIDLGKAISTSPMHGPYEIVTLLIGVNDQYRGLDTAGYRKRFAELLQTALMLAGKQKSHVFVLSIPDYSVTPAGKEKQDLTSKEIDIFNNINRQITRDASIAYIDITSISREADPSLVANDGLHPSGKQYKKWAELLGPVIEQALK